MTRVAIYTRVSTDDQAKEGFSLDAQQERLAAYCEAQGWDVAAVYVDEGQSGRNTKRPAYQRMIAERDSWDTILVMKMDRIHRNSKNFMIMMEDLEKWGKKFTSMQESLDTSNAVGRFVVDIIQRIAQLESEQIGERTKMGMSQKAESGEGIMGFNPPYGYRIHEKELTPVAEEAELVRDIFFRYAAGECMSEIAWKLNNGERFTRRGNNWTVWSISQLLHNPAYAGWKVWDGIRAPGKHPALIDVDLFNRVQVRISEQVKNPRHKHLIELPKGADAT